LRTSRASFPNTFITSFISKYQLVCYLFLFFRGSLSYLSKYLVGSEILVRSRSDFDVLRLTPAGRVLASYVPLLTYLSNAHIRRVWVLLSVPTKVLQKTAKQLSLLRIGHVYAMQGIVFIPDGSFGNSLQRHITAS
jgi:hypothetical protein